LVVPGLDDVVAVVDDDEAIRDSLKLLLETCGFGVGTYESAQEFLSDAEAERSCCLVLDIHMPGMNGVELLRTLQAAARNVPTVVITGRPDAALCRQALAAGARAVFEKPVNDGTLLDTIRGIVGGRG
jgi:two-component system, LuxR family, response regulator FixJ